VRWWDGSAWTDHVASGGRQGRDPAPGSEVVADLVNRVVAAALGFVDLADEMPGTVTDTTVTTALWREATTRRDILVLAHGHLAGLEQQGSERTRAKALSYITKALDTPPLLPR
jgi:hypothetical protein